MRINIRESSALIMLSWYGSSNYSSAEGSYSFLTPS